MKTCIGCEHHETSRRTNLFCVAIDHHCKLDGRWLGFLPTTPDDCPKEELINEDHKRKES
jgi:hypothetical protein